MKNNWVTNSFEIVNCFECVMISNEKLENDSKGEKRGVLKNQNH